MESERPIDRKDDPNLLARRIAEEAANMSADINSSLQRGEMVRLRVFRKDQILGDYVFLSDGPSESVDLIVEVYKRT